jgi:hypothetical protein
MTRCMLWLSSACSVPQRWPGFAEQMLYGFIEICRVVKRASCGVIAQTSPGRADSSAGCVSLPSSEALLRFCRLLMLRCRVADNQHVRLELLTIMLSSH